MFRHPNRICIELEDDGIGFEVSEIQVKPETSTGFGLFNIKERMEYIGGRCHIVSRKKRGTKVTLTAPLSQTKQE
jgi:signal transduction histidine kinase